jgi:hypothetical protein
MATETAMCIVCGEPADAKMSSECNQCGGRFHLNQRNDVEAKDCGRVWIDEQFLALQFACDTCLAPETAADPRSSAPDLAAHRQSRDVPSAPARRRRYKRIE